MLDLFEISGSLRSIGEIADGVDDVEKGRGVRIVEGRVAVDSDTSSRGSMALEGAGSLAEAGKDEDEGIEVEVDSLMDERMSKGVMAVSIRVEDDNSEGELGRSGSLSWEAGCEVALGEDLDDDDGDDDGDDDDDDSPEEEELEVEEEGAEAIVDVDESVLCPIPCS